MTSLRLDKHKALEPNICLNHTSLYKRGYCHQTHCPYSPNIRNHFHRRPRQIHNRYSRCRASPVEKSDLQKTKNLAHCKHKTLRKMLLQDGNNAASRALNSCEGQLSPGQEHQSSFPALGFDISSGSTTVGSEILHSPNSFLGLLHSS